MLKKADIGVGLYLLFAIVFFIVPIPSIFSAIKPHAYILRQEFVVEIAVISVFSVDTLWFGPLCGSVFNRPSIILCGRKINHDTYRIDQQEYKNRLCRLCTPYN